MALISAVVLHKTDATIQHWNAAQQKIAGPEKPRGGLFLLVFIHCIVF